MISMTPSYLLYFFPVLIAVSLVISATRWEDRSKILHHWLLNIGWTTVFLLVVAALMQFAMWMI